MINPAQISKHLTSRFGLELLCQAMGEDGKDCSLRVDGIDAPNGFQVRIQQGWRTIEATFIPDTFAAGLIKTICVAEESRKAEFFILLKSFSGSGIKCEVSINGVLTNAFQENLIWSKFELKCSKLTDVKTAQSNGERVGEACLALLLSLLPTEENDLDSVIEVCGFPEGALIRVEVNRYERHPSNRVAAIAVHGTRCVACDFDFSEIYGKLGESFIEVHHTVPVSALGDGYVIDPATDLVPLCANCHRMVHRQSPPIAVAALKSLLRRNI